MTTYFHDPISLGEYQRTKYFIQVLSKFGFCSYKVRYKALHRLYDKLEKYGLEEG